MIKLIKTSFYQEKKTKQALKKFITEAEILSFSTYCQQFEKKFSKFQARKYTTFVNSGSSANLALLQALINLGRLKRGDKVGFSAVTWSTNVMPIIQLGLVPIPVDIEISTLNASSKTLQSTLKQHKIKAFFITNLLGFCDDIDKIQEICASKKILLIEDNCESLGSVYKGKLLGNFGVASTFSFYVGHHMSSIEGGAVCTDDEELSDMLNLVRAHGWDRNMSENQQNAIRSKHSINSSFYSRYTFYDLGFNLRPTEINGFLGVTQLVYLDEIISKREQNFKYLSQAIYKNENYYPLQFDHMDKVSNFAMPIVAKSVEIRKKLVEVCKNRVEIRPIVGGDMTQQPFYKKYYKNSDRELTKNARLVHSQGLYFGNNPELTKKELKELLSIFA